jgi:hypothetical protein
MRASAPVPAATVRRPETASGDVKHRVITLARRTLERRGDIAHFEQRMVAEDFIAACAGGQQVEDISDPDSQTA